MTVKFEYKCRRCGVIHTGPCMGGQTDKTKAALMLISATPDFQLGHSESKTIPALSLHACFDGGTGIADLNGFATEV